MRRYQSEDKTVIQQSTTFDARDYADLNVSRLMLGIVLDVTPADRDGNRSAQQSTERRGFVHECSVLVIDDAQPTYLVLEHVLITPDSPMGIDNCEENLPRATTGLVSGGDYNPDLTGIDPHDLDGDRCVVGFLGRKLDSPFVLRWWPHSRNSLDVGTSGGGIDGNTLQQLGRYFRRINGVETVITSEGNIVVSTTLANSSMTPSEAPQRGRIARQTNPDVGGSVRVNIKPTQTMELTWNEQEEGIGIMDTAEEELPQTNPFQKSPQPSNERPNTYIYIDIDQVDIYVPATALVSAGEQITLKAPRIALEENTDKAKDPVILGEQHRTWLRDVCVVLSPFGPLKIDPNTLSTPYDATQSTISFVE